MFLPLQDAVSAVYTRAVQEVLKSVSNIFANLYSIISCIYAYHLTTSTCIAPNSLVSHFLITSLQRRYQVASQRSFCKLAVEVYTIVNTALHCSRGGYCREDCRMGFHVWLNANFMRGRERSYQRGHPCIINTIMR